MKYKKILTLSFVILLVLGLFVSAKADSPTLTLIVPEKLPAIGETFEVNLEIIDNPGFSSFVFFLDYNDSSVECISVKDGDAILGMMTASNPKATVSGVNARIAGASSTDIQENGTISVFKFKVLSNESPMLSVSKMSFYSCVGDEINLSLKVEFVPSSSIDDDSPVQQPIVLPEHPAEDDSYPFTDVPDSHWARQIISDAFTKGLVNGIDSGIFAPDNYVTRAQFVTMLWRAAGSPEPETAVNFNDVLSDAWYYKQVAWAAENKYVNGVSASLFNPDGLVTREQAMTILFRYNGGKSGQELMFTSVFDKEFSDSAMISAYAKPAVYWAYYNGIISGISKTELAPDGRASRAQIATILLRYMDKF